MKDKKEPKILEGKLGDAPGRFVFNPEGYYLGFINTNETSLGGIIPGPDGIVAGVLLPDGTLQNPDGSKSEHTDPVKYLLSNVEPIKKPDYHVSNFGKQDSGKQERQSEVKQVETKQAVTLGEFYEMIRKTYESNNYISTVKVEFYDGANPVKMIFKSEEGFAQNQTMREGTIESLMD